MAYEAFSTVVQNTIKKIGEVSGTSVQTYSEPRVQTDVKSIFELAFRKLWWPQYMQWFEVALDGTLGVVTGDLTTIRRVEDIRAIFPERSDKPLPMMPKGRNPFNLSGTTVRFWESILAGSTSPNYTTKKVQFWPKAATGNLKIHARIFPTIVDATILYIDNDALVNGAAWSILEAEDINPNAAATCRELFEEHFVTIKKAWADQPIENPQAYPGNATYMSDWQVP